jgi:hypothetical protein
MDRAHSNQGVALYRVRRRDALITSDDATTHSGTRCKAMISRFDYKCGRYQPHDTDNRNLAEFRAGVASDNLISDY